MSFFKMPHASLFVSFIPLSSDDIFLRTFVKYLFVWFGCFPSVNSYNLVTLCFMHLVPCFSYHFVVALLKLMSKQLVGSPSSPRHLPSFQEGSAARSVSSNLLASICLGILLLKNGHLGKDSQGALKEGRTRGQLPNSIHQLN